METVWDTFWKDKGSKMEWSREEILQSKNLQNLSEKILKLLNKSSLKNVNLVEIGSGIGITSLFFASKGANATLLDKSKEIVTPAKSYWGKVAKPNFIFSDIFAFKPTKKYDVVTSFGLCEHFIGENRKGILLKHLELLKKDGVVLISVPYKYGIFYRIGKFVAERLGIWSFGLEVPFSKKEFKSFAKENNLQYEIMMSGFYSSIYDLFVRKPFKVILKKNIKRRFDDTKSISDNFFGSGMVILAKRN